VTLEDRCELLSAFSDYVTRVNRDALEREIESFYSGYKSALND